MDWITPSGAHAHPWFYLLTLPPPFLRLYVYDSVFFLYIYEFCSILSSHLNLHVWLGLNYDQDWALKWFLLTKQTTSSLPTYPST